MKPHQISFLVLSWLILIPVEGIKKKNIKLTRSLVGNKGSRKKERGEQRGKEGRNKGRRRGERDGFRRETKYVSCLGGIIFRNIGTSFTSSRILSKITLW